MSRKTTLSTFVFCICLTTLVSAQESTVIPVYKTDQAPELDGVISPGEWDAAGPAIFTDQAWENIPDLDPHGGAEDLSYQFRVMWEEPWMVYFLFEVTDDIAMDENPVNDWERDMVSIYIDGDDLEGNEDGDSFHWWETEIFGKFSVSRFGDFEGNTGAMAPSVDDLFADEFGFLAATGQALENGDNGDYVVEMALTLEPMWWHGTFDGTETGDAEQIVQNATVVKWLADATDDDNFDTGDTERSGGLTYNRVPGEADWRDSTSFSDLAFVGPYNPEAGPQLEAGDANQDLEFNQMDLVQVQISAKYLTGAAATWGEGDWDGAPGGSVGDPPAGDGQFNQLDIIAALNAGTYLNGPYAAVTPGGAAGDEQTSVVYNANTGEVSVDAPASTELTSVNVESAAGIFTGDPAQNLGGGFDNDVDGNIFKATFGDSFGSVSFGKVAQPGLSAEFVANDLTVAGSLEGGGELGNVDLIYIPEPSAFALSVFGLLGMLGIARRR